MKISLAPTLKSYNRNFKSQEKNNSLCPRLKPFGCDCVSFGAIPKVELNEIDLFLIDKFKIPRDSFNSYEEFLKICEDKIQEIKQERFPGDRRMLIIRPQKTKMWEDFLNNNKYSSDYKLLIIDGITKFFGRNNEEEPPVFISEIIDSTINEISHRLKNETGGTVCFRTLYDKRSVTEAIKDLEPDNPDMKNGWIFIKGRRKSPNNFNKNVNWLKILSSRAWCTKRDSALTYLSAGDMKIYIKNKKAKLAVATKNEENMPYEITEIQGVKNNGKIPLRFYHLVENLPKNTKLSQKAQAEYDYAQKALKKIEIIKQKLEKMGVKNFSNNKPLGNCSVEQLFSAIGINFCKDKDGNLIIDEYRQPEGFTYDDVKINEDNLFKKISYIKGNANFVYGDATSLGILKGIGGDADFDFSKVVDLGDLQYIGGDAIYDNSKLKPEDFEKIKIGEN